MKRARGDVRDRRAVDIGGPFTDVAPPMSAGTFRCTGLTPPADASAAAMADARAPRRSRHARVGTGAVGVEIDAAGGAAVEVTGARARRHRGA